MGYGFSPRLSKRNGKKMGAKNKKSTSLGRETNSYPRHLDRLKMERVARRRGERREQGEHGFSPRPLRLGAAKLFLSLEAFHGRSYRDCAFHLFLPLDIHSFTMYCAAVISSQAKREPTA
jgi:hypothetical protein